MRDTPLAAPAAQPAPLLPDAPRITGEPAPSTPARPGPAALRKGFGTLTLVLLVYVTYEALRPEPPSHSSLQHLDKLLHFAAFTTLALTAGMAAGKNVRAVGAVVAALLLYGAAIEVVQGFIPGRDASFLDLLADAVGIAAGLTLARLARHLPGWHSTS